MCHFVTLARPPLKLWNESRTNRARIADSRRLPFRSPQHLAWGWPAGTRSSLARSNKPGFEGEFLKVADDVESNQKRARVNRIPRALQYSSCPGLSRASTSFSSKQPRGWP